MRYIIIEATFRPGTLDAKKYREAWVSCWIKRRSKREAAGIARKMLRAYGLVPGKIIEEYIIRKTHYDRKRTGKKYFEQALIDGTVLVVFTCPRQAEKN